MRCIDNENLGLTRRIVKSRREIRDLQKRQIREAVKKLAMKVKYSFIVVDLVSSLSISGIYFKYN